MANFFRNVDDQYSDPEILAAQYKIGRNAFFEVQLTLAEFNDRIVSNSGGLAGSPALIAAIGGGGGYGGPPGDGDIVLGCPEVNEWVWTARDTCIKAKELPELVNKIGLYNPRTGKSNLLVKAEVLKNQPLYETVTKSGVSGVSSVTHTLLRNVKDRVGTPLISSEIGREVLKFCGTSTNCFIDYLDKISQVDFGDVVRISLAEEFIYLSGSTKKFALAAHNTKL